MVYITGDTHIPVDVNKLSVKKFPEQKSLTKNDYIIICGDFGGVWDGSNEEKYWIKWFKSKSFTTLFVDGNHENFDKLNKLSVIEFGGSMVHKVDDGIYHLMRGEVYNIDNRAIFTFGGADSHDKACRTEGINWWKAEMPDSEEYRKAEENLRRYNYNVDYIITHSASTTVQNKIAPQYEKNELTEFLEKIKSKIEYRKWFFGHYHKDIAVDEKHIAIFNDLIKI